MMMARRNIIDNLKRIESKTSTAGMYSGACWRYILYSVCSPTGRGTRFKPLEVMSSNLSTRTIRERSPILEEAIGLGPMRWGFESLRSYYLGSLSPYRTVNPAADIRGVGRREVQILGDPPFTINFLSEYNAKLTDECQNTVRKQKGYYE